MIGFVFWKDLSGLSVESGSVGNKADVDSSKQWGWCGLDYGRGHADGEKGRPGEGFK